MLCSKHSGQQYISSVGVCGNCASNTSSGSFALCAGCSKKLNRCQVANCTNKVQSGSGGGGGKGGGSK